MFYEELLQVLNNFSNGLKITTDKNNRIERVIRSTFDKNECIITIPNGYYSGGETTYKVNLSQLQNITLREFAEIICPLGFVIFKRIDWEFDFFHISKLSSKFKGLVYKTGISSRSLLYISENNINKIQILLYANLKQVFEPVDFNKAHFLGYLHWGLRRNAMLVAFKYKNGRFFHILKWIALFL